MTPDDYGLRWSGPAHGWNGARRPTEPAAIARPLPAAGRRCGREPLPDAPDWTADEAARALLLAALPGEHAASADASTAR